MKKIILIILLSIFCFNIISAQRTDPTPTVEETKEAQELAAKFFNRYAETQDITPLIKEFFIKDFDKRVNYCFRTVRCGGHNRDFWKEFDNSFTSVKSKVSFQQPYAVGINFIYLYSKVFQYLSPVDDDITIDVPEAVVKENIKNGLISLLNQEPKLLKSAFRLFQIDSRSKDGSSDFEMPKFRTKTNF